MCSVWEVNDSKSGFSWLYTRLKGEYPPSVGDAHVLWAKQAHLMYRSQAPPLFLIWAISMSLIVRINLSATREPWFPTDTTVLLTFKASQMYEKMREHSAGSASCSICFGGPKQKMTCSNNASAIAHASELYSGTAMTYRVTTHTTTNMYLWPLLLGGMNFRSNEIYENGV